MRKSFLIQSDFLNKQTELLAHEKKPILAFKKTHDGSMWAFEIENSSKYILIKEVNFKPIKNFEKRLIC